MKVNHNRPDGFQEQEKRTKMVYVNIYCEGEFECYFDFNNKQDAIDYCEYMFNETPIWEGDSVANLYY